MSPKMEAHGMAALMRMVKGEEFPVTKRELIDHHGDEIIHWSESSSGPLRGYLQRITKDKFNTATELAQEIGKIA